MLEVDRLEAAAGGPFTYVHRGEVRGLPSPLEISASEVRLRLHDGHRRGLPMDMPEWKAAALFEAWRLHYDLPTTKDVERLVYTIERWPRAVEADLHLFANGTDLGEMWRTRRWRLLLNLIDHLPGHSYTATATANDEEHAAKLAEYLAEHKKDDEEDPGPPIHRWTPEVSILADLVDAVRIGLYQNLAAAVGGSAKAGPPPKPYPRPKTAFSRARERAEYDRKRRNHESLARRLLPHKYKSTD